MINEISLDSGIMTTQARPNGFETLLRISAATAGSPDLPDLLRAVAYSLREALDLDHFVVGLVDEAAGRFTFPLWLEGDEARLVPPSDFHHDQSLLCLATRLRQPLANADAFALKHVNQLAPGLPLPASYLAVPLVGQAALGPVGGLVIGSSQVGAYGPDELDLLKIVASVVNLAAEKAQLRESASRYARSPEDVTRKREMDQMKDELVNVVSHELRTPLASVLGFAELLLTRDFPEAKRRQVIETIYKEAERLSALINEFLDLRRLESGALPFAFTPVNLAELAQSVVAHYALGQRQHDLQLDVPEALPLVHADPVQLGQVLRNLLDNAFKYSPNGGRVTLAARAMGDTVRVTVHDQGLGLPAGAIPRLFERFYRVDSSDRREIGGTGLGLSIVKEIIRAHGGQVWAESPGPGQGSTFGLALRLAVPVATVQATASTTAPKEPYVLIVEDDPGMVSLIQEHMQAANYRTAVVTQPAAALNLIRQRLPLGLVLDVCLPDPQQGWSLLEAIRQLHPASELPVITISVLDERDKALALGATEYLVK
ncbi:MAG: ATP-binding response regulator, partial [Anaerolineales bacterium]